MRFSKALLLGTALIGTGVEAGGLRRRQAVTSPPSSTPSAPSGGEGSSPSDGGSSPPGGGGGSTTPGGGSGPDTTIFVTETVTDNNVATITSGTTVFTTITSTVVVTKTAFTTTTVTSRDQDTATKTVWETSTEWANKKRAIDLAPRTVGPAVNIAVPTAAAADELEEQLRRHYAPIDARAIITRVNTVTVGADAKTTVVNTVTQTVISTKSSDTTITNTVTETDQADAKTTVTVTSTLTITSTAVTTGVLATTTALPPGSYNPGATQSAKPDNNSSSGDSSGLSSGAKAGIGVGAAVGGIAVIALIVWFIMRSRRRGPKPDPDDLMGASEVPVGGPVGHSPMSHHASSASPAAAAFLAPGRSPVKPSHSPEGYRGTAMGDGRAGYAKPEPYGAAYAPSPATGYSHPTNRSSTLVSGGTPDHLPEHPMPAEMDSAAAGRHGGVPQPHPGASEMDTQPPVHHSPPSNVYEMPATNYR